MPATFRSNDLYVVSQMYPDRVELFGWDIIFSYATASFVVGSAVLKLFHDFDSVQSAQWGYGVSTRTIGAAWIFDAGGWGACRFTTVPEAASHDEATGMRTRPR